MRIKRKKLQAVQKNLDHLMWLTDTLAPGSNFVIPSSSKAFGLLQAALISLSEELDNG